jgi:hypothetical protein
VKRVVAGAFVAIAVVLGAIAVAVDRYIEANNQGRDDAVQVIVCETRAALQEVLDESAALRNVPNPVNVECEDE